MINDNSINIVLQEHFIHDLRIKDHELWVSASRYSNAISVLMSV